jgi:hypothetical protein
MRTLPKVKACEMQSAEIHDGLGETPLELIKYVQEEFDRDCEDDEDEDCDNE